jgi:hypothetical protein
VRIYIFFATLFWTGQVFAGPKEIARKLHGRLASVPPSETVLNDMATLIEAGRFEEAAQIAMNNENFYAITLYNFFTPWTNRDQTMDAPLNDTVATKIGFVRDNIPFNRILSSDTIYHFAEESQGQRIWTTTAAPNGALTPEGTIRAPRSNSNDHYQQGQSKLLPFGDPQTFVRNTQSQLTFSTRTGTDGITTPYSDRLAGRIPANVAAGAITTRGFAEAFFSAGTNRRAWRYIAINYLCLDMEDLHDTSVSNMFIRRDVTRSPTGDGLVFLNKCAGCHAGMDALSVAFNFHDFRDGEVQWGLPTSDGQGRIMQPASKTNRNEQNFPAGYVNTNENWQNLWTSGLNSRLGWRTPESGQSLVSGTGARSLGEVVTSTRQFSKCMVSRTFKKVCARNSFPSEEQKVSLIQDQFENGYNMKDLFARTAKVCLGGE